MGLAQAPTTIWRKGCDTLTAKHFTAEAYEMTTSADISAPAELRAGPAIGQRPTVWRTRVERALPYLVGAVAAVAATLATVAIQHTTDETTLVPLVLAVMSVAIYGGMRAGVATLALATLLAWYFVIDSHYSLVLLEGGSLTRLVLFLGAGGSTLVILQRLQASQQRTRAALRSNEALNRELSDTIERLELTTRRKQFLLEASAALGSSRDYDETLGSVAKLAVPVIADYCIIDLKDGNGFQYGVAYHRDPEQVALLERLRDEYPLEPTADRGYPRVSRSGDVELWPHVTDDTLRRIAVDAAHLSIMRQLEVRSSLIVPLKIGGDTIGALTLGMSESRRAFSEADVPLAEDFARRAAVAIEQTQLYSEKDRLNERARLAAEGARFGTWEWDLGPTVVWSENLETMYGFAPGEYPGTFAAFMDRVHPDDREFVAASIEATLKGGKDLDFEHRVLHASGEVTWHNGRGRLYRDANGNPARMIGIGIDITDRKRIEQALADAMEELRQANEAKDEFLGLVSHELRTPITTIFGNARTLRARANAISAEDRDAAMADIEHESDRLQRIIENLLVLARFEQNPVIDVEPLLVPQLVEGIVASFQRRRTSREVQISVRPEASIANGQPTYF
ncbi:MAG TPA: PAS domain-containing protein, partial [Dehalococcoidia bacterium]